MKKDRDDICPKCGSEEFWLLKDLPVTPEKKRYDVEVKCDKCYERRTIELVF